MENLSVIKINLGCGSRHNPPPWVNCDNHHHARPDRLFDFGKDDWPFPDGSCDEILARHCLEHLDNGRQLNRAMKEAYRVLVPGGRFEIEVPHPRSDYFIGDPTHGLAITKPTLDLYSKVWCEECVQRGLANTPLALQLGVDFKMVSFVYELNERWNDKILDAEKNIRNDDMFGFVLSSYNNVVDAMSFVLERV